MTYTRAIYYCLMIAIVFLNVKDAIGLKSGYFRVCYYYFPAIPIDRNVTGFTSAEINPKLCSHVVYAFATMYGSYRWHNAYDWLVLPHMATEIEQLKLINPSLKVLIGLVRTKSEGKWIDARTGNLTNVFTYASTTLKFLRSHQFDGVNIDFNYADTHASNASAEPDFSRLIYELRAVFDDEASRSSSPPLLLTAFVCTPELHIEHEDMPFLIRHLDWIGLIPQEVHEWIHVDRYWRRTQATKTMKIAADILIAKGCPPDKIVLGLLVDSIAYKPQEVAKFDAMPTYNKICQVVGSSPPGEVIYKDEMMTVSEDMYDWGFKKWWLENNRFAGFLFWRPKFHRGIERWCFDKKFPTLAIISDRGPENRPQYVIVHEQD